MNLKYFLAHETVWLGEFPYRLLPCFSQDTFFLLIRSNDHIAKLAEYF